MSVLTQYSIVCQVPGAEPYTVCAYSGEDLSKVLGINQANMPEGHYGWILECGNVFVNTGGQTQAAYADFRPNAAKRHLTEELSKRPQEQAAELPPSAMATVPTIHGRGFLSCHPYLLRLVPIAHSSGRLGTCLSMDTSMLALQCAVFHLRGFSGTRLRPLVPHGKR